MNFNYITALKDKKHWVYVVQTAALLLTAAALYLFIVGYKAYFLWKAVLLFISLGILFSFNVYSLFSAKYENMTLKKTLVSVAVGLGILGVGAIVMTVTNRITFRGVEYPYYAICTVIFWAFCLIVLNILFVVYAAEGFLKGDKFWKRLVAATLSLIIIGIAAVPTSVYIAREVKSSETINFIAPPCLFENDKYYSVIWGTDEMGSGTVEVVDKDGETSVYNGKYIDGIPDIYNKIHRVDVPRTVLENAYAYRVLTKRSYNPGRYAYELSDEPIVSPYYKLREKNTGEEISFLCISDVQGAEFYAMTATANAYKNYSYDFVLTVGDYSSNYCSEDDVLYTLLGPAGLASNGEIPVLYVTGNHETRGSFARELAEIFPTPSETDERYYTYNYGENLFMTVLNFADHREDDAFENYGVSDFDAYRAEEYNWLMNEVVRKKPYSGYKYHVAVSHVPIIDNENEYRTSISRLNNFKLLLEQSGVKLLVSAHTHTEPRLLGAEDCFFKNIQVGSTFKNEEKKPGYRNSIITPTEDGCKYVVYQSFEEYKY